MVNRRLIVSLLAGIVLGIFCIIGSYIRSGFEFEPILLFSLWYNRVIMGLVIGLAPGKLSSMNVLIFRGALIGTLISFAFYSSTGFQDPIGFIAGIIYGIIIDYTAYKL